MDTTFEYYINNWYLEMDLKCIESADIGIMISAYFLGSAATGLFFTVPDQIGRKKSLFIVMVLSCVAQTVMIFVPNF